MICIDTVREDVFYGLDGVYTDSFTPWRERALLFDQAVSTSSWTAPAMGSIFSGLWQSGHGAGQLPSVALIPGTSQVPLTTGIVKPTGVYEDVPLLAEAAVEKGFHTVAISGSPWTNSAGNPMGLNKGFEKKLDIGTNDSGRGFALMREAFAAKDGDAPFFYYMHFMEAHDWHMRQEEQLDRRLSKFSVQERAAYLQLAPSSACEDEQSLLCKRYLVYASAVHQQRKSLARVLASMEEEGLLEDTVVVLFSDHGEEFGDHAHDPRTAKSVEAVPGRFIGHGQSMYQELVRVPLMVWHPDYDGATISALVSLVDVAPTVARWLGIEFMPAEWPGRYLDDTLKSPGQGSERVVYSSGTALGEQQMSVQQGSSKSIWYMSSDEYDYYDLEADPLEMSPITSDQLVLRFDGLFLDYISNSRKLDLKPAHLTAEQIKKLQAIGYLQGVETKE